MTDMTIKLLQQIRDEMKATRVELSERIDQTNHRLDRVEHRQTETEIRLETELVAVSTAIADLKNVIVEDLQLRAKVSNHETRIKALEGKRTG